MRTTVDIQDELLRRAKTRAAEEGKTLKAFFEEALRAHLKPRRKKGRYRLKWRTEGGTLNPRANIDNRNELLDFMDGLS